MGLPYKNLLSYWQHYWNHCLEKLADKDNVSFKMLGPRMLMQDIIDEIEGHGLSNPDNIDYFKRQIGELDKKDEVFRYLCHPMVACLLQRLGNKTNRDSSILLCKKILNRLAVKRYFTLLVDWLAEAIDNTAESNYESRKKINEITHLVISEFIAEGFVPDEIKRYATDIPGVAIAEGGVVLVAPTEFDSLKAADFESEEEYYKAVYERIKNRNAHQSLEVLKYYYYITPREAFFIVRLNGLKGQIDDHIGDINIYSPKVKRYIKDGHSLSKVEEVTEDRDSVNAAIPIDFTSIEQAKVYARAKLEEVLDIMTLTYRTQAPITIATNRYSVVADGEEISMSVSVKGNDPQLFDRDEMMRYFDALDLTELKGDGFKFLTDKHEVVEMGQGVLRRRLKNAARWYSKAIAADKDVDVLLYSWFAIEGLLKVGNQTQTEMADKNKDVNSLNVIQEFVTSIICKSYFQSYLRETYRIFLYHTNLNGMYNNYYDLKDDVIDKAGLNLKAGDHYKDGAFLSAVTDLTACINDDIVRDELAEMQAFYQSDEGIKAKASHIKDDLLMIYRLRNMIVHNAALSSVNISFYAREAIYIAQRVIRYVIDHIGGNKTIEEIVLGAKLDYQVFMQNFDEELNKLKNKGV